MSAKIKLNAASGGGSVSLQAPTSTTGNANIELKLPVADGSGFLKSDGSGNLSNSLTTSGTDNFTIADGNLIIGTGGHGIDFSAQTPAAGANNELFSHYEQGTWTPSLGWGLTPASATGSYTRIGNIVCAYSVVTWPSNTNLNYVLVGGLPFTASSSGNCGGGFLRYSNYNGAHEFMFHVNNNGTAFVIYLSTGGGTITNQALASKQVQACLIYKVS